MGATLFVDGKFLGIALGSVIASGLFISTNWLVFRGTADESVHAMLLVNYLPGYSISLAGSIIGALEVFAATFLLSWLFSWIYNAVASSRSEKPQ
jgi:NhaP-type Na+/H+ or K+/H+ antiporter